ncbi:interferon-induced GTP-binding protein Mx2 [Microdochium bolleyi]|uniref:Interferon-induced GTP-binding protein Mx2 n=1 Tax=Microdochium bolleyi TaxID=196109 RepID=A0A136JCI2_9PEZI|nr:interferon-induced GTP-binding protein Mx2 [Microdochium bolleyi]
MPAADGLGNQATLSKIDKLRELNVGAIIPLPQLIVVGDQSSGKSSVLEGLTGFSFPRAAGLCTRYATQITCRREDHESVSITIIPRPQADEALKEKLRGFQRSATKLDNNELAKVFEDANKAMGIRMGTAGEAAIGGAFSEDILKIEICGPAQSHLTVIDVPGIFRNATPGLTTDNDVQLVRNMVKSYMSNTRTVILAVMPCNVDIATQEIIKLAEAADPNGLRTMGVLTKPDLATEKATQNAVIDLLLGKRSNLNLGYCAVKNRSADDNDSTMAERRSSEQVFFSAPEWSGVVDRCGVPSLQHRLRELLMQISKREFPNVKVEIERKLKACETALEAMGLSRGDESSQRLFLGRAASRFQRIAECAVSGQYIADPLFKRISTLKLATRMMELNEDFANDFWKRGHKFQLGSDGVEREEKPFISQSSPELCGDINLTKYGAIEDIIETEEYTCPLPLRMPLLAHVQDLYRLNRGPEIGTFGGTILGMVFEEQSEKWDALVLTHVSKSIVLVHDFIEDLLSELCQDEQVHEQLWELLLIDKLRSAYRRAMDHARFLLTVERGGRPTTFNHYFNTTLQKKRAERLAAGIEEIEPVDAPFPKGSTKYFTVESVKNHFVPKDNSEQVCTDIVDTLDSSYKVARKRFVDTICQQAINHYLLDREDSPLKILCPELVMGLTAKQLDQIAGEDSSSRRQRDILTRQRDGLQAAKKVLRE